MTLIYEPTQIYLLSRASEQKKVGEVGFLISKQAQTGTLRMEGTH